MREKERKGKIRVHLPEKKEKNPPVRFVQLGGINTRLNL